MAEDLLKKMFLEKVRNELDSVRTALREGLLAPEDLDADNPRHVDAVLDWSRESRKPVPVAFVSKALGRDLADVAGPSDPPHPMRQEAIWEVGRRLAEGWNDALVDQLANVFGLSGRYARLESKFPVRVQELIAPHLSDPAVVPDKFWSRVRSGLAAPLEKTIVAARATAKARATRAKLACVDLSAKDVQAGSSDPLIAALAANDVGRLCGLDLQRLKPERWKKAEPLFVHPDRTPEVRAFMGRLPWQFVEPHAALILEACALVEVSCHKTPGLPRWPIPKAVLFGLSPRAASFWLGKMMDALGSNPAATVTPPIRLDEVRTGLTLDAIAGEEARLQLEWLGRLEKLRRFKALAKEEGPVDEKAAKPLRAVMVGLPSVYVSGPAYLNLTKNSEGKEFLDLFSYMTSRPRHEQIRLAKAAATVDEFQEECGKIFGCEADGPVNFLTDDVDDTPASKDQSTRIRRFDDVDDGAADAADPA